MLRPLRICDREGLGMPHVSANCELLSPVDSMNVLSRDAIFESMIQLNKKIIPKTSSDNKNREFYLHLQMNPPFKGGNYELKK